MELEIYYRVYKTRQSSPILTHISLAHTLASYLFMMLLI
jgi:hypothetical protein